MANLQRRLATLEASFITPDPYAAHRRRAWLEIKADREQYGRYVERLDTSLKEDARACLARLSDEEADYVGWLVEHICKTHHASGAPLRLPYRLLAAFLERPGAWVDEPKPYDGILRIYQSACHVCGYGMPYRFWSKAPGEVVHRGYVYDLPLEACPLCDIAITHARSYFGEHGYHPNGEARTRRPLLLYPFTNSVADGTRPSDSGVTMPPGWGDG